MCDLLYYLGVVIVVILWKYLESINVVWKYLMLLGKYIKSNNSVLFSMKVLLLIV